MYVLVKEFLLAQSIITGKWTAFAALFASFVDYITEIFSVSGQQEDDKSGVTLTKSQLNKKLVEKIQEISEKCRAYATVAEDFEFLSLIKFMKGDLQRLADADLIKTAKTFHANVLPKLALVAEYDLVQADLDELLVLSDSFLDIYTKPKSNIKTKAQLTARLNVLFDLADAILLKIDAMVQSARKSEPEFVDEYTRKRAIVKTAARTLAFKLKVVDDATGLPFANAVVTYKATASADLAKNVKRSGPQGGITDKNLAVGEYSYMVEFGGYISATGTFNINEGVTTEVVVRLKKRE
jgi:hypothetical protein